MDYIVAWQCIGCGKIEAPQPCIGVCQDRKVLMVGKGDYEAVVAELDAVQARLAAVRDMLQRFGLARVRTGQWQQSWDALQTQLREALRVLDAGAA